MRYSSRKVKIEEEYDNSVLQIGLSGAQCRTGTPRLSAYLFAILYGKFNISKNNKIFIIYKKYS